MDPRQDRPASAHPIEEVFRVSPTRQPREHLPAGGSRDIDPLAHDQAEMGARGRRSPARGDDRLELEDEPRLVGGGEAVNGGGGGGVGDVEANFDCNERERRVRQTVRERVELKENGAYMR